MRLLTGPRGTGDNNYNTSSAEINFAIPSLSLLNKFSQNVSSVIPPSIFENILQGIGETANCNEKQFILSFDGKSVAPGLKNNNEGGVDLWGFESNPNLQDSRDRLLDEENFLQQIRENVINNSTQKLREDLQKLIKIVTERICDIRKIISKCQRTEEKYIKADFHKTYIVTGDFFNLCIQFNPACCECRMHIEFVCFQLFPMEPSRITVYVLTPRRQCIFL